MSHKKAERKTADERFVCDAHIDVIEMMKQEMASPHTQNCSTGVAALDQLIKRHIGPGRILVIVGPPDSGKTAIAVSAALACLKAGESVGVAAHDHDPTAWPTRIAQLDGIAEKTLVPDHLRLNHPELFVGAGSLESVAACMPAKGGVLICDSIQSAHVNERPHGDGTVERLEAVMRVLTREARMQRRWVIALSERAISRIGGSYTPRGSAAIAHAADVMMTLDAHGKADARRLTATIGRPSLGEVALCIDSSGALLAEVDDLDGIVELAPGQRSPSRRMRRQRRRSGPSDVVNKVRAHLAKYPNATREETRRAVGRRKKDVCAAYAQVMMETL